MAGLSWINLCYFNSTIFFDCTNSPAVILYIYVPVLICTPASFNPSQLTVYVPLSTSPANNVLTSWPSISFTARGCSSPPATRAWVCFTFSAALSTTFLAMPQSHRKKASSPSHRNVRMERKAHTKQSWRRSSGATHRRRDSPRRDRTAASRRSR